MSVRNNDYLSPAQPQYNQCTPQRLNGGFTAIYACIMVMVTLKQCELCIVPWEKTPDSPRFSILQAKKLGGAWERGWWCNVKKFHTSGLHTENMARRANWEFLKCNNFPKVYGWRHPRPPHNAALYFTHTCNCCIPPNAQSWWEHSQWAIATP